MVSDTRLSSEWRRTGDGVGVPGLGYVQLGREGRKRRKREGGGG